MPIPLDPESSSHPGMFPAPPAPFERADDVREVARTVLARFDELRDLNEAIDTDVAVTFWFDNAPFDPIKDEVTHDTIGKALKSPPFWRVESGFDAAVIVSRAFWDIFSTQQREATVLHELLHIGVKRDKHGRVTGVSIAKHSIEEYTAVIRHFGSWLPDRAAFFKAFSTWQREQDAPVDR